MVLKKIIPNRWTIGCRMALISFVGLAGLLALGGIGYWASSHLADTSSTALQRETEARELSGRTYDAALQSEAQVHVLADLNAGLIDLQQMVVEGSSRRRKGVAAEDILRQAQELAKKAEVVRTVKGADRIVPGTKGMTLADQVIGNFVDVATLVEYELPDLYLEEPGSDEFVRKQGSMVVSMTGMYWFISRTLKELSNEISAEVVSARTDVAKVIEEADRLTERTKAELDGASRQANLGLLGTFLAAIAVLGPLFGLFFFAIVTPLKKTVAMAEALKAGRVDSRLDVGKRNDEFGDMASALNDFADSLEHEVAEGLQAIAGGDLTVEAHPVDERDVVRTALQKMTADMTDLVGQLQCASGRIASQSSQVSDSSQYLSQGATESASSLEEISASIHQLESQTRQNAENALQANGLAGEAKNAAEKGSAQMDDMLSAMAEINKSGESISKIIKVIDEIAFQTNLLALNAAVEAARAGKHGKGFAVVAEEVRNLAARSAKAAKETAELIEGSVKKAQNGARIAEKMFASLEEIGGGVTKVSDLVEEIAAASNEQSLGISEINQGVGQIDQVTQQNTASAEESAAAAMELSEQANRLQQMLGRFRLEGGAEGPDQLYLG